MPLPGSSQMGNVLLQQAPIYMRQAQAVAGIPYSVPLYGINRQCSSGLQAVGTVANAIKAGEYACGIAGGVESMSCVDMMASIDPAKISPAVLANDAARNCLLPMGITSENVASAYGITRLQQDQMAVDSHAKAVRAQKLGLYSEEIVPVHTTVKDKEHKVTVTKDEGMREGLTLEALGKLKPAFKKGGTTTAGNSSQVSDGAAAVLLARRDFAEKAGLPIVAVFRSFQVAGVPPEVQTPSLPTLSLSPSLPTHTVSHCVSLTVSPHTVTVSGDGHRPGVRHPGGAQGGGRDHRRHRRVRGERGVRVAGQVLRGRAGHPRRQAQPQGEANQSTSRFGCTCLPGLLGSSCAACMGGSKTALAGSKSGFGLRKIGRLGD